MNLPDDIESAYVISKKISPVTQDAAPALEYISNFIRPISNDIVTRLQNVPERDSSRSNRVDITNSERHSSHQTGRSNHTFQNTHNNTME